MLRHCEGNMHSQHSLWTESHTWKPEEDQGHLSCSPRQAPVTQCRAYTGIEAPLVFSDG